jgi:hypothetical protein
MRIRFSWLALALCWAACGSQTAQGPRVRSEFTVDDAVLFEDGVDLIEDPEQLVGQWKVDWDRDLDRRVAQSDLVALGTVTTLHADVDLEHRTTYQIVFRIERTLEGERPPSEIILVSRQGAGGYASVTEHRDHLLERKLAVFVKYAPGEAGAVVGHFHLSAPSKVVLQRMEQYEAQKHPASVRIIEHRQ